jgi:hypothetical protein
VQRHHLPRSVVIVAALLSAPLLANCGTGHSHKADRAVCTAWGQYQHDIQSKASSAAGGDLDAVEVAATAAGHSKISGAAKSLVQEIHSFATSRTMTERPSLSDARLLATSCSKLGVSLSKSRPAA